MKSGGANSHTLKLVESILRSWKALVMYFKMSSEKESLGYYNYLLDNDKLELIAYIADATSYI